MSQQPFTAAALRGAVDLSAFKRPASAPGQPAGAAAPGAPGSRAAAGGSAALVVEGTDASLRDVLASSAQHPVLLVVWSSRLQESGDFVDTMRAVARRYAGRFQLVTVDADANPAVLQAFQVQAVPVSFALVAGQPVPLFEGAQPEEQVIAIVDQVLALAAQHGVTGTVEAADGDVAGSGATEEPEEPPLPPLHQKAFDAIEADDLDTAAGAYREALAQNPADADARVGLAQVGLLQRTRDADPQAARAAAAADPADVQAQILVADLDLLGGHVEDAFSRLVDTVRVTADADRNTVREHLVELFEVIGTTDERVGRARKALMSALF
ncbi:tetratricopeptide repeat protein [Terracoccus luteus]|jgi:putative thioredoxin|uniref:Putative thioredoxin n=1 Tax=Terracoccus luteus TaxID=53356 RepID=A0A839PTP8_9MICO|nr:tetratricopeptide repeat protein [Terracoccus luteus]MBB2985366.1 putative thioredoxin [Terracoccus luteus]MCP2171018.1 putative thioredoxin [Terracoccus luteus]